MTTTFLPRARTRGRAGTRRAAGSAPLVLVARALWFWERGELREERGERERERERRRLVSFWVEKHKSTAISRAGWRVGSCAGPDQCGARVVGLGVGERERGCVLLSSKERERGTLTPPLWFNACLGQFPLSPAGSAHCEERGDACTVDGVWISVDRCEKGGGGAGAGGARSLIGAPVVVAVRPPLPSSKASWGARALASVGDRLKSCLYFQSSKAAPTLRSHRPVSGW
jgi:hypothetical protein